MTITLPLETMIKLIRLCVHDSEGWAKTTLLVRDITKELGCSQPTAYKFLDIYPEYFELFHGKIREIKHDSGEDREFVKWHKERSAILDKYAEFLSKLPYSPRIEQLLVRLGMIRQALTYGDESKMEEMRIILEMDFGYKEVEVTEK